MNLRSWFKDKEKALLLHRAMHEIFKDDLRKSNYLHVDFIESSHDPDAYISQYMEKGYLYRILATNNIGTFPVHQFYATLLLTAEALGGFVEVSIDGTDFRSLTVSDPSRNETLFFNAREVLDELGIKVMEY